MYKKGTLVLVPFPFTNLSGSKVRPAVVISDKLKGDDIVVLFLTSKSKTKQKNTVPVVANSQNGLRVNSAVVCSKFATLDKGIILGELGELSASEIKKINASIRLILKL